MGLVAQAGAAASSSINQKTNVINLLNQKASKADSEATVASKSFTRGEIDLKAFLDQYIGKRAEYHKFQVLKVKVNQG